MRNRFICIFGISVSTAVYILPAFADASARPAPYPGAYCATYPKEYTCFMLKELRDGTFIYGASLNSVYPGICTENVSVYTNCSLTQTERFDTYIEKHTYYCSAPPSIPSSGC